MSYKTPQALQRAVNAAARKEPGDTSRLSRNFYFERFLERIFSEEEPAFILKGGQSALARSSGARMTTDIDLLFRGNNVEEALAELKRIGLIDLEDHLVFRLEGYKTIGEEQKYRDGYKVTFTPILGVKEMSRMKIDLVIDSSGSVIPEIVTSASRLIVQGLPIFDYWLYPLADAIADKVGATMQSYGDYESSRVKDLVDLMVYLTTAEIEGNKLSTALKRELALRGIGEPDSFSIPASWKSDMAAHYRKLAGETRIEESLCEPENAEQLVCKCVNPALRGEVNGMAWDYLEREWMS